VRQKSSLDVIQRNWFSVSSRKSSSAVEVQSYLSAFESVQLPLLFAVVNLADADVCYRYLNFQFWVFRDGPSLLKESVGITGADFFRVAEPIV